MVYDSWLTNRPKYCHSTMTQPFGWLLVLILHIPWLGCSIPSEPPKTQIPTRYRPTCNDPGYVMNANRVGYEFVYNSNVTYTCIEGYRMIGTPFMLCKTDGTWNRRKPTCQRIECQELAKDGSLYYDYSNSFFYNSIATAKCDLGYRTNSNRDIVRTCQDNGLWTESVISPQCVKITCRKPPGLHEGYRVIGRKFEYQPGDSILILCETGDKERGSSRCLPDGTWSGKPPNCDRPGVKWCPAIPYPSHGKHNENQTLPLRLKTRVVFVCDDGYLLEGAHVVVCQPNNKWTGKVPTCSIKEEVKDVVTSESSKLTFLLAAICLIVFVIFSLVFVLIFRWHRRQQQRRRWQRYFGPYSCRQSKTNITGSNNTTEMKLFRQPNKNQVPVTDL